MTISKGLDDLFAKTVVAETGIKLGGVAAKNLLDDYQGSGTWTPGLDAQGGGGITSFTTSVADGTFVKVGNLVFAQFDLRLASITIGPGTGAVIITGLPFTAAQQVTSGGIGTAINFASGPPISTIVDGAGTHIRLAGLSATSISQMDISVFSGNEIMIGTVAYFV
jgi:hypothetical protein